jgi:hypothetical protein
VGWGFRLPPRLPPLNAYDEGYRNLFAAQGIWAKVFCREK